MDIEWSDGSKYNSFNSWKGLTYYQHYQKTVGWLAGQNPLPPPIEANLDPYAECNLNCYFCITQRYLRHQRGEVGPMRKLPTDYLYRLVDFLAAWGVQGLCISGGGEPSLHEGVWGLPTYAADRGMDVAFVTNGVSISEELAVNLLKCRWVSFSVDAADRVTYLKVKSKDRFDAVVANIRRLTQMRQEVHSKVDFCFKYLVLPENISSISQACRLAKELGVQDFHVRPVDFERPDIRGHKPLSIDVPRVKEEFTRCHEEETMDFHVYTVTHKFNSDFHVEHNFTRCFATLILPILTDGNAYLCVDRKMEAKYRLGSCFPDPTQILNSWGNEAHRQLMQGVDISTCSRCTGSQYNMQTENVVLEDRLCRNFP